jgi:23S rRNA (adenine2503-C2)-methyltransferase
MGPQRPDIASLDEAGLLDAMGDLGEPAFRARQLVAWLHGRGVRDFSAMTDLPLPLRDELARRYEIGETELVERRESRDGTRKYLWRLADGAEVESVGLPHERRVTVCFSTQAGCAMGCAFCATGRGGFERDLTAGEMADQVRLVGADLGERVTNAVAMGQGEPFANYDATVGALRLMNSPRCLDIGARHLTVSTCGVVAGIDRFAGEPEQFTLAVSLHSAVQETRDRLMPGVRGDDLARLQQAIAHYTDRTRRRVTLEYALVPGANDGEVELAALESFCEGLLCHVNVIPANPVQGAGIEPERPGEVRELVARLESAGIAASARVERGADIDAACGQLRLRRRGGETGQMPPHAGQSPQASGS